MGILVGLLVTFGCIHLAGVFQLGFWGLVGSIVIGIVVGSKVNS